MNQDTHDVFSVLQNVESLYNYLEVGKNSRFFPQTIKRVIRENGLFIKQTGQVQDMRKIHVKEIAEAWKAE